MRAHPALPRAVAGFAGWLIDTYTKNALLNLVLSDRGRVLLGFFVLYLDVLPLPGTRERGATVSAVQSLCRSTGVCSAGRAASVIALMRFGGYVSQTPDPDDRRRRVLVPTPRLLGAYTRNWVAQFEAMAPLFPEAASMPGRLQRAAFRTEFLRALGEPFLAGFRVLEHAPILESLAESNAATLILSELALNQLGDSGRQGDAVPLSVSTLARRFRVSRAHVRNILATAHSAALVTHGPAMGGLIVQPALIEALMQFYGTLFILFNRCAMAAFNQSRPPQ